MPKKKRDKKISLTKTSKKGLAFKQKLVEDIRECLGKFKSIYIFKFVNIRNRTLKEVRKTWHPSRIFIGKNKVMTLGLGRKKEDELEKGLHKLAPFLRGQRGLLFTNCDNKEVIDWFESYSFEEYGRSGFKTTCTVTLNEGPLKEFSHTQEPYLRKLGLPVKLDKGVVTLTKDYEVCKEGSILTPAQAKILELLDRKLAIFKLILKARWTKGEGFEKFATTDESEDEEKGDKEEEMETDGDDDDDTAE